MAGLRTESDSLKDIAESRNGRMLSHPRLIIFHLDPN